MAAFLQLPHEILQHVLAEVRAKDLAALTASFRELQKFITGNRLLHQKVYVNHFVSFVNINVIVFKSDMTRMILLL